MLCVEIADYQAERDVIHGIRYEVFVQEQCVPADLEIDGQDAKSIHVLAYWDGQAVGTGRLLQTGHIGRVAVLHPFRHQGIGRLIMERLLQAAQAKNYGTVVISAQCHAIDFYRKLGFEKQGKVYREAGIDHIKMVKPLGAATAQFRPSPANLCSPVPRQPFGPAAQPNLGSDIGRGLVVFPQ